MHSSGMRTVRLLTVSQHALGRGVYPSMHWAGGVCIPACNGQSMCLSQHALPRGGGVTNTPSLGPEADTPLWTDRHLWKHNLRKLRLRAVIKYVFAVQGKIEEPEWVSHSWSLMEEGLNVHSKPEWQTRCLRQRHLSFEFMTPSRDNMVSVYSCVTNVLANWAFNGRHRVTVVM